MLREVLTLIRPAGRMGVHNSKHAAFRPSRQLAYRSSATCTAQKDIILYYTFTFGYDSVCYGSNRLVWFSFHETLDKIEHEDIGKE